MLARAAAAGAAAAGGQVLTYGLDSPVQGAWVSASRMLPISLFIEEGEERVFLHFFDCQGLPLERARERKLEHALLQGEFRRVRARQVGQMERLELTRRQWADQVAAAASLGHPALRRVTVAVEGNGPDDRAIRAGPPVPGLPGGGPLAAGHPGLPGQPRRLLSYRPG